MKRGLVIWIIGTLLGYSAAMSAAVTYCAPSAFGYGRNATGGSSATPVLVSNLDGLKAISKAKNKVFVITSSITMTSMVTLQDMENVTILALPGVTLTNLQQTSSTSGVLYIKRTSNLIIRNITFVGPGAYDCDGNDLLCFEKVTNAWVDHCDFQDGCDGNFDNKSLTDNVTVSWCRFHYLKAPRAGGSGGSDDHRFTNLLGSSSSDAPSDGIYNFTWAYCWWDEGCKERMVRCRNAELHFLNCYWNSSVANYYVGPENAKAYFEGCTFEGKANSSSKIFKSYGGTNACKFVDCSGNLPANSGTVSAPGYAYTASGQAEAKTAVTNASCGAGATLIVTTAGAISSTCDGGGSGLAIPTLTLTSGQASQTVTSGDAITNIVYTASGTANDISVTNLPTGVTYSKSGLVLTISGNPTTTSTYTVTATNADGVTVSLQGTITANTGGGTQIGGSDDYIYYWQMSGTAAPANGTTLTAVGGSLYAGTSDGSKSFSTESAGYVSSVPASMKAADNKGIKLGANALYFTATLTSGNFLAGDTVFICGYNPWKISSSSTQSGDIAASLETGGAKDTYNVNYVILSSNTSELYFMRASGNGTGITAIKVCRPATPPAPTPHTLTYDENGGSGTTMADQTGTTLTVATNTYTAPTGYEFNTWNTNRSGNGTSYAEGASISPTTDLTLYAIWRPLTYTVTLDAGSGSGGDASVTATFDAAMPNIAIPTWADHTFLGYFTGADGTGTQYYDANGSSTNSWAIANNSTTLYAAWAAGTTPEPTGCDLHFWFIKAADAPSGISNDETVFSGMVANSTTKNGVITLDGTSYNVTGRTGDPTDGVFGSFTIPAGKTGTFYALAVSSGNGDRQINLVCSPNTYELTVAGGSDSYKRIESEELPAGTYSIERGGGNVRLGIVVVRLCSTLAASAAPTITAQPTGNTYCAGDGISALSVTATGSGTVTYQWQKDGVDISGATSASYTPSESGTYTCVVTNTEDGKSATSLTTDNAVVTINAAIATPTFSQTDNTVNISTATAGATIYYTTDGSNPTTSSASGTSYTVTTDCTIKAYAVKDGCSSSVASFNATYTPIIVYTVTYNANGGSVSPASVTQTSTGASVSLATPTRDGYTFLGWYIGATKIGDGGDSYIPTDDITAIAAWKKDCVGGSESATISIGNSSSSSYAASFTSSSTNANITASATSFTKGSSTTSSNSAYSSATAPYSIKFKPSSNINTSEWSDNYSVSAQFTVATNYTFAPSSISATIVTEAANYTYQAILTDGITTYTSSDVASSANGVSSFTFPSLSGTALSGTITFKIRYKSTANNAKFFVINLPITINGDVAVSGGGDCLFVTYDGNGADGGFTNDPEAYDADDVVTVLANSFTKSGTDVFKGWAATTAHRDAGTVDYIPGRTFTITANTTLYAIWGPACTTPDAPTSPTNGATTTVSQEVSWADTGNSLWEVYISTSSTAPALDQTPTASPTATSYTFTGLTHSTPYYWWIRSVCDASHKSAWVAGPNFTTATPTYTLTNEVSPAGYGIVTPASVADILLGTTSSSSSNTYTVGSTTVTATPAAATAQYTYAFDSWIGLPDEVTADATVTAKFSRAPRTYTVTLNTNGGTINSGNVTEYTYGTGATLPTDITRDGNYEFKGWYDNVGLTGSPVTTISVDATGDTAFWAKWISCPAANSGDIVYKFVVNSSVSDGNICSSGNNPRYLTTPTDLSTLIGGTLQGNITNSSSWNNLTYASGRITYNNGDKGVLSITLDCPLQEGDLIRFNNYSSSNSKYNYLRHTSYSTSTDQLTLNASKTATEIQQIVVPAEFAGKTDLFIVSGDRTTGISYFEIIRSCPLTLDAGTNGGTVGGAGTQVIRVANGDEVALPHAFKDGYTFAGWFTAPSGGSPVSNPYTATGATTLYAQFEDCPHDGTIYKFEVGTGLTDGAVTANGVTFNFNTSNYLSALIGGTLTGDGSSASYIQISGTNAISIGNNNAYLKVDLDCEIHEGDVFKSTVSGNTVYVSKATSRTKTVELPIGTLTQTPIPAALIGEKTLYLWKGDGSSNALKYFEITRPKQTNITLDATGAYNKYTSSVVATYEQAMPEIATLPLRTGYVFGGYYDAPNGAGTQYYNGLGYGVRNWDKDVITATLYAYWIEPCNVAPTLETIVPMVTIWDGRKADMALVQLSCDFDTTGIHYSLVSASEAISGCTFAYFDERIYIQGTPTLGNASTVTKTITFTMTNDCSPASTYTVTATIRIYPAGQKAKIAYIVRGTKGGGFNEYNSSDESNSSALLTYLRTFYDVDCVNGYATKDATEIANFYKDYDLLIVTDYMETPEGYTNAIGILIDKKPILSFEAYVAGEHGTNWHIGSNPKDPSPKVQDMKILCAGHAIFKDAEGVDVINDADTTVHVLDALSSAGDAKGLQGFVINEAPDFIFLATVRDANHNRDLIVCCERQVVFPARLLLYGINYYEMGNLSDAGRVVMHQMIDYLLMTDETKVADCSLVFDNGAGNTSFDPGAYSGSGTRGDGKWSTAANWAPGYNIVPTPYHPTRIIAECHVYNDDAHAGSVKVNKGRDEHGNPVDGRLIIEPEGGLTIAGVVQKVNDTRYASPITIKAEDLLIKADATHNGALVYGNKESDVNATVQYYSRGEGAHSANPVWQYIGIPFQANKTAINMYYEAWMCRWEKSSGLGGLWEWVDNNDVLIPFEGYCITQETAKTYTNSGKLNPPTTTTIVLDNRDADGFAFAANSWTAPIKIQEMADDDFTNAEKSIYIYHTGSYANWTANGVPVNAHDGSAATLPGQYAVIPIHSSPYLTGADSVIPSMQGFFVKTTAEDAELKLVYNQVVYDAKYFKTSTQPMRMRRQVAAEPNVMVLLVCGATSGGDRVHLLSRSDFSDSFEDGWDGRKIAGDSVAPMLSVVKEAGDMTVAAIPSMDNRYLSFRAGKDVEYTFSFDYDGEELYLYDIITEKATRIRTGNTYSFSAINETPQQRFLITSNPPQLPTTIDNTLNDEIQAQQIEKFIRNDKLFILYRGEIYDALGKRVKISK